MNLTDEFRKYAIKQHGVNSLYYDKIVGSMTPYIMEERQLNVAQMDVFSRLMMDRIIFLGTDVNDQVANIVTAQLLFLESVDSGKDIQIYINSPGGSVYAGLGIYDTMQFIKPDVATICMIHQPSGGAQGVASDMEINLKEMLKLKNELYEIIAKHSKQPFAKVYKDSERDYWMIAREAKEYGMIDEVLERK